MNFSGIRVLVIGDVMLDQYIAGTAGRISPEAPIPVVQKREVWTAPGGAANVARNLARLGVSARLVGLAGNDAAGEALARALDDEGVNNGLVCSAGRSTTCKTRIISQGQQLLRLDEESVSPPAAAEAHVLRKLIVELLEPCHAVILSDYGKGMLLETSHNGCLASMTIALARERGIPVLVDPKGGNWARYRGAYCVTPNSSEFAQACGLDPRESSAARSVRQEAAQLQRRYSLDNLLLTRGARGMTLFRQETAQDIRSVAREVADVSGAGDTVIATLTACVASGMALPESARVANMAAGIAVSKVGTAPVGIDELNAVLHERDGNPKLLPLPALLEKVQEWRRQKKRIVFTNGCFDLLHPGHVSLIREAAAQGDRLVIGLNSDRSVRRLKGASRPIQDEQSRAQVLAALANVDAVTIFDEDTPLALIESIRPHVLVKGGDYTPETVVGADVVRDGGGHVHLAELVSGCSTTELVQRLRRAGMPDVR